MKVLGIGAPFGHGASAALIVDGKLCACVEEERFTRVVGAAGQMPLNAVRFCLAYAGLAPADVDCIAFPWSALTLRDKRWRYFSRAWRAQPTQALGRMIDTVCEASRQRRYLAATLDECGFSAHIRVEWVEHHLAHAASGFFFSGFSDASVISMDRGGDLIATLVGSAGTEGIRKIKEIVSPDSLADFYSAISGYLGFCRGGESSAMDMASRGSAAKIDLDRILHWDPEAKTYHYDDGYLCADGRRMIREFGPKRAEGGLSEPYIHIAAAAQHKLEKMTIKLLETYCAGDLGRHGNLCVSGGCALNTALNRVLDTHPAVRNLWVPPAPGDNGAALGAAAYAAAEGGDRIEAMKHAFYGPEFGNEKIEHEIRKTGFMFSREPNICARVARLLADGKIVGWFQGRLEFGPHALGNRSILGNPTLRSTAGRIHAIRNSRERLMPLPVSLLAEFSPDFVGFHAPTPFFTIACAASPQAKERIPDAVRSDGTILPQTVDKGANNEFYRVIEQFKMLTGIPAVTNASLASDGEPLCCSPADALRFLRKSGLEYLAMGHFLIEKTKGEQR